MSNLASYSADLIIWLGALIVFVAAMGRFNNPRLLIEESSLDGKSWQHFLKDMLSWSPGRQSILLKPPRANTTAFRYRLYQSFYALIALLIYFLLLFQPDIRAELQEIISWFVQQGVPDIGNASPLVVSAFVIVIFPNVPPFRWGDTVIRTWLYDYALIPAQQLREVNRLKIAPYHPPQYLLDQVRELALAEGFDEADIHYNNQHPTTQSLWSKCMLLVEQLKTWEADDHYKTAFAVLREPDSEMRSADSVKEMRRNLMSDAQVLFNQLRASNGDKSDELIERENVFRTNCCVLLKKIYTVLAGISLHSHYSDNERIRQFGEYGFELEHESSGPLPDANDMLMLAIILCTIIVLPLAMKLGLIRALSIGTMMFSAVLAPVMLARFCPGLSDSTARRYCPNLIYPLFSALLAAALGFLIYVISSQFASTPGSCGIGVERYLNCSYPWGIMHAGVALMLALRLTTGQYPDVNKLLGWRRYQQWGSFTDAIICAIGMILITAFIALPLLEILRPDRFQIVYLPSTASEFFFWRITLRMALAGFVLGFFVPTWYRAHKSPYGEANRRKNSKQRQRFEEDLKKIRQGPVPSKNQGHAATG